MNKDKISSQEIIDLVATKLSISKRVSEEFLKNMFSTIEEALLAGESVKLKNFGTFKLQWNEPRKSVNVNTGEEIVLEGYNKITFVPDNSLKDIVNEPFAHLESVVLDDVVLEKQAPTDPLRMFNEQALEIKNILSEINSTPKSKEDINENSAELILNNEIDPEEIKSEIIEQTELTDVETIVEPVELQHIEHDIEEEIIINNPPEPVENLIPPVEIINTEEKNTSELIEPKILVEQENKEANKIVQIIQSKVDNDDAIEEKFRIKKKKLFLLSLPFLLMIVVGLLYFYNLPFHTWTNKNILSTAVNPINWIDNSPNSSAPPDKLIAQIADSILRDSSNTVKAVDTLELLFQNARKYDEFITIDRARTLNSFKALSEKFYGHNAFWVYIYEANKDQVGDTISFKSGTLFKIPKIHEKLIDLNNRRSFEMAKKLHAILFNKSTVSPKPAATAAPVSNSMKQDAPVAVKSEIPTPKATTSLATITIKQGDRLTTYAKKYYKHKDFWFYIYEANKDVIKDPDNLPVGMAIKIPKLDPSLIDVNNPACIQKARKLYEIYVQKNK